MEVLEEITRNLLVIIVISTVLEMMLPEGSTRPFVRFAVGMFVLIAILTPSLNYLYDDVTFQVSAWDNRGSQYDYQNINNGGKKIQEQIKGQGNSLLQEKLEDQIGAVAILVPGVDDVDAQIVMGDNGIPRKIELVVSSSSPAKNDGIGPVEVWAGNDDVDRMDKSQISGKMKKIITNLYGVEADDIEIVFEGS